MIGPLLAALLAASGPSAARPAPDAFVTSAGLFAASRGWKVEWTALAQLEREGAAVQVAMLCDFRSSAVSAKYLVQLHEGGSWLLDSRDGRACAEAEQVPGPSDRGAIGALRIRAPTTGDLVAVGLRDGHWVVLPSWRAADGGVESAADGRPVPTLLVARAGSRSPDSPQEIVEVGSGWSGRLDAQLQVSAHLAGPDPTGGDPGGVSLAISFPDDVLVLATAATPEEALKDLDHLELAWRAPGADAVTRLGLWPKLGGGVRERWLGGGQAEGARSMSSSLHQIDLTLPLSAFGVSGAGPWEVPFAAAYFDVDALGDEPTVVATQQHPEAPGPRLMVCCDAQALGVESGPRPTLEAVLSREPEWIPAMPAFVPAPQARAAPASAPPRDPGEVLGDGASPERLWSLLGALWPHLLLAVGLLWTTAMTEQRSLSRVTMAAGTGLLAGLVGLRIASGLEGLMPLLPVLLAVPIGALGAGIGWLGSRRPGAGRTVWMIAVAVIYLSLVLLHAMRR